MRKEKERQQIGIRKESNTMKKLNSLPLAAKIFLGLALGIVAGVCFLCLLYTSDAADE